MHPSTRRLWPFPNTSTAPGLGALLAPQRARTLAATTIAAATVALGAGAAPSAHAAAPGVVTANATDGMNYTASNDGTAIVITQDGNQLTVNDTVPLKAGAGCAPVAGDATKATCVVALTKSKSFKVGARDGDDTVTNLTSLEMRADGGLGKDSLYGGDVTDILVGGPNDDKLRGGDGNDRVEGGGDHDSLDGSAGIDSLFGGTGDDILRGGSGDNDYLDGGAGGDLLNGGSGEHDLVNYDGRTAYVGVALAQPNTSLSTNNGEHGENDQITQVEDARGSAGDDLLIGNERDNNLYAYVGTTSTLIGRAGADLLVGTQGPDFLHAGDPFLGGDDFGFVDDGVRDRLHAEGGDDQCVSSATDPDFESECE